MLSKNVVCIQTVERLGEADSECAAAGGRYDQIRERLGKRDPADPTFGMAKQKKVDSWLPEVRELGLLRDVYALESQATRDIGQALSAM